jgi:hypothetical protein
MPAAELPQNAAPLLELGGVLGIIDHAGNPDADNAAIYRMAKAQHAGTGYPPLLPALLVNTPRIV